MKSGSIKDEPINMSPANLSKNINDSDITLLSTKIFIFVGPSQMVFNIKNNVSDFPDNKIRTTKYNLLTWFPKSLIIQFFKVLNLYFLIISILSSLSISNKNPIFQIGSFLLVLLFTMIYEGYDDYYRLLRDRKMNEKTWEVYSYDELTFRSKKSENIRVGEIVRVKKDEQIPCDLLFLMSSNSSGKCFVDTKNLNGDFNLKEKIIHPLFKTIENDTLSFLEGILNICLPNEFHDFWDCNFIMNTPEIVAKCGINQLILMGSTLKNTEYIVGIVVHTFDNTKIMKNVKNNSNKISNLMTKLNAFINTVIINLIALCMLISLVYISSSLSNPTIYNPHNYGFHKIADLIIDWLYHFLTLKVLFSNIIPISMYVALDILRIIQSHIIYYDEKIYDEKMEYPSIENSSDLIEELGQVDFIFSDKTGTLTQNVMEFRKCSINGIIYNDIKNLSEKIKSPIKGGEIVNRTLLKWDHIKEEEIININQFFTIISICHNSSVENNDEGVIKYMSYSSPDEIALIEGACKLGYIFKYKTSDSIAIENHLKELEIYELLAEIPFDSTRKRMSVIVRKRGKKKIICMTKGSDDVIMEKCIFLNLKSKQDYEDHLNLFASEGLRTLVLGIKEIEADFFIEWLENYNIACHISESKEKQIKLNILYDQIENDFEPVGCCAIEDKLQIDVIETIEYIHQSNIKLWVLTGDKIETSLNVVKACNIIKEIGINQIDLTVNEEDQDINLFERLDLIENKLNIKNKTMKEIKNLYINENYYMIIDGRNLIKILYDDSLALKFFRVGYVCKSVIFCRLSPKQKSEVVSMAKKYYKCIALSIGDGSNDVSMIMEANVGVGIQGFEGSHAVGSADYSILQFRYLKRLLLVHGRYGYRRISLFICFYFYKNAIIMISEFYFSFYNKFSGQVFFLDSLTFFYHVLWTSWPCIFTFSFEKDVDENKFYSFPKLYMAGQTQFYFNKTTFWMWLFYAFAHGSLINFIILLAIKFEPQKEGKIIDHWNYSTLSISIIIHVVTYKMLIEINTWNYVIMCEIYINNRFISIFSIFLYYFTLTILNEPHISKLIQNELCALFLNQISNYYFWIVIITSPFLVILIDISNKYISKIGFPNPADYLLINDYLEIDQINKEKKIKELDK